MTLDILLVRIEADISGLRTALNQAAALTQDAGRKMESSLSRAEPAFARLGQTLGRFATAAGVGTLARFGQSILKSVGDIGELADSLGLTTKALQEYQFAAAQVGVSQDALVQGFSQFARQIGEARSGNEQSIRFFKNLGGEVDNLVASGADVSQVFRATAQAIGSIDDPARRVAAAMQGFGRGGRQFVNLFIEGRAGLDRFADEAARLGVVIDDTLIRQANAATAALTVMWMQLKVLFFEVFQPAILVLQQTRKEIELIAKVARDAGAAIERLTGVKSPLLGPSEPRAAPDVPAAGAGGLTTPTVQKLKDEQHALELLIAAHRGEGASVAAVEQAVRALAVVRQQGVEVGSAEYFQILDTIKAIDGLKRTLDVLNESQQATIEFWIEADKEMLEAHAALETLNKGHADIGRSIDNEIADNARLIEALGHSARAYELEAKFIELRNQHRALGRDIGPDLEEQLRQQAEFLSDQERQLKTNTDIARELGLTFTSAFEDAVVGGEKFRDVLRAIAQDIQRLILRKTVTEPAAAFLTKGITSVLNAGLSGLAGGLFGFQHGGEVTAHKPIVVGEKRPEVFVPRVGGTILPSTGSLAGSPVNVTFHINAGVAPTIRAEVMNMMPAITSRIIASMEDRQQRGVRV